MSITLQILFPLFLLVSAVVGQTQSSAATSAAVPTSTAGLDPCIMTCSQQAATAAGCGSFTNVTCVCTSQQFQTLAAACLQANCTAADLQAALGLQSQICKGISASGSASGSSLPTGSGASGPGPVSVSSTGAGSAPSGSATSPTGAGSSSSGAATSSGAALGRYSGFAFGKELAALGVAAAGAVLGGALVL